MVFKVNAGLRELRNLFGGSDDDLIRRGDAIQAIRNACILAHLPFSSATPEGQRALEAIRAVRNVPAAKEAEDNG